jgi:hypothetical protein
MDNQLGTAKKNLQAGPISLLLNKEDKKLV